MSMLKKLTDLAKSEKATELADKATAKAKQLASDPETREKIDAARRKISDRVGVGAPKPTAPGPGSATPGAPVDGPDGTNKAA